MNPYLSIYNKDYYPKKAKKYEIKKNAAEFENPLSESFKNYLQLSSNETPLKPPIGNADTYLNELETLYPKHCKIHFKKPVNNTVMTKVFIYNGRTTYQVDYCDLIKDTEFKEEMRRKNMFRLPDDWNIPLTIQNYSYRNPLVINPNAMAEVKPTRTPNNLDPQPHLREILKVTTGKSDYMGVIGELGELIMDDELHGKITLV